MAGPNVNCATCKFWFANSTTYEGQEYSECRRMPPTTGAFPKTEPNFWCGEWRATSKGGRSSKTTPMPDLPENPFDTTPPEQAIASRIAESVAAGAISGVLVEIGKLLMVHGPQNLRISDQTYYLALLDENGRKMESPHGVMMGFDMEEISKFYANLEKVKT